MIIPVRCYTCGAPIARYWEEFARRVKAGEEPGKVLDDLGVRRLCCRRILLAHVPLIHEVTRFKRIL